MQFNSKWNKKELIQFMIESLGFKKEVLEGQSKARLLEQIPVDVKEPYRKKLENMWREMK